MSTGTLKTLRTRRQNGIPLALPNVLPSCQYCSRTSSSGKTRELNASKIN